MSGEWIPKTSSGAWKRWRNTSKSKSSAVRVITSPLEDMKETARKLLEDAETIKRLQITFDNNRMPAQDDLLVLLGMWTAIELRGEAADPEHLLHTIAPYMKDEAVGTWQDKYARMHVDVRS